MSKPKKTIYRKQSYNKNYLYYTLGDNDEEIPVRPLTTFGQDIPDYTWTFIDDNGNRYTPNLKNNDSEEIRQGEEPGFFEKAMSYSNKHYYNPVLGAAARWNDSWRNDTNPVKALLHSPFSFANPYTMAASTVDNLTNDDGLIKTWRLYNESDGSSTRRLAWQRSLLGDLGEGLMVLPAAGKAVKVAKEFKYPWEVVNLSKPDITERFLKFVGSSGDVNKPAIPRTLALIEQYALLKAAGVDMSKVSIEDINKALKLREELLLASGKRFSYHLPVTENSEILYDVDNGLKVGYIDLRKPYQTNDRNFSEEAWNLYINNLKNKGLRIGMVENMSATNPDAYDQVYKGVLERLTNSSIDVAKQLGYEGVVSGESLLSPEKTVRMYPKYKHKRIIGKNGRYHWEIHNPEMSELVGPIYMLEKPTFKTITKSLVFNPEIIDSNGKMKINWGKGNTMFNSILIPTMLTSSIVGLN